MGVLEDNAEGQIEGTDAVDLGQGPTILLESLGLGFAAFQDGSDGIDELFFSCSSRKIACCRRAFRRRRETCLILLT